MDRFRFRYTQFKNRVSNANNNNIAKLLPDFVKIFQNAGKSLKTTFPFKQYQYLSMFNQNGETKIVRT